MCYNILETYCTNIPLNYSHPVTYIVVNYVLLNSIPHAVMRTGFSESHKIDSQGWSGGNMDPRPLEPKVIDKLLVPPG